MSLVYEGTLDDLATKLMTSCNVDRARAEVLARRALGVPEPTIAPEQAERDAKILEDKEQWEIVKLFRAYGCKVYNLSQKRAAKQTPGLADLYVTRRQSGHAFWFETKRQVGGIYSTSQIEFREENDAAGVLCWGGDRYDAASLLVDLGLAMRDGAGVWGISPK